MNIKDCKIIRSNAYIIVSMVAFLLANGQVNECQAQFYNAAAINGGDPVWDDSCYHYFDNDDDVVTNEAELLAAINAATNYDVDKPYVIPIANDIMLTAAITLANKNIVLRKATVTDAPEPADNTYSRRNAQGKWVNPKWWNFNDPWVNTKAATPDMYDGEPDVFLIVNGDYRHFNITGACCLTTENITLWGRNECVTYYHKPDGARDNALPGGGICLDTMDATVALACNVAHTCNEAGGAISAPYCTDNDIDLYIKGGVISHTRSATGGGIHYGYAKSCAPKTIEVSGYTIIEDVFSHGEGGGFYIIGNNLTVNIVDHVVIRRNTGGAGGGIHTQRGTFLNLRDNVLIQNNRTLALAKVTTLYPGNGGGIYLADYDGDGTQGCAIYDNVIIECNLATRGGGGIAAGNAINSTPGCLTLYGGIIRNNVALGTARELLSDYKAADRHAIGSGGAIYAYDPKRIVIPISSTVYFDGNAAETMVFIECNDLKNQTTGLPFLMGDDYYSHIHNKNIHTSVVNSVRERNYFNLYNNYDIGIPSRRTRNFTCLIGLTVVLLTALFIYLSKMYRKKRKKKRILSCL